MATLSKDEREDFQELLEMLGVAVGAFHCPYFQYHEGITKQYGTCTSGCYSEPSCVTDDNVLGYLSTIKTCADELTEIFERLRNE